MEKTLIKQYEITFLEEPHLYLVDGILVPSVSKILSFIFPDKYKGVPKSILNAKANYGTKVHESIEILENGNSFEEVVEKLNLDYIQRASLRQYLQLKKEHQLITKKQEMMINYKYHYAGRFDMIAEIGGFNCLCDIKTTAILDEEYLSWQLSFYELATGIEFDKLYAIWLPKKGLGKLKEINRKTKEELIEKIKEYEESNYGKN